MILAAGASIILGVGALRGRAADERVSNPATIAVALGIATFPCIGPFAFAIGFVLSGLIGPARGCMP